MIIPTSLEISYVSFNSFRNMNMCLLEVAMCEKCRSSHFQSEGGVKSLSTWGSVKYFRTRGGGGVTDLGGLTFPGGSVPYYMPWKHWLLKFEILLVFVSINCNFSRYLDRPSHRNNHPLPFSTFWHDMKFCIPLRISHYGYLRISLWQKELVFDTINWATWVIQKMISNQ